MSIDVMDRLREALASGASFPYGKGKVCHRSACVVCGEVADCTFMCSACWEFGGSDYGTATLERDVPEMIAEIRRNRLEGRCPAEERAFLDAVQRATADPKAFWAALTPAQGYALQRTRPQTYYIGPWFKSGDAFYRSNGAVIMAEAMTEEDKGRLDKMLRKSRYVLVDEPEGGGE